MLAATSSSILPLLLFLCTTNIHFVSGKGRKGVQRGSSCKANRLARVLHQKVNENLNKQRVEAGESASQMGQLERAFKRELDSMENQRACLGGAKLEAQLGKTIDIMKEVEKASKHVCLTA